MEHRHGCVVLRNGKVISKGYNHPRIRIINKNRLSCSTHAEMSAILSLKNKKANSILVIRINKDGQLCDSKPCQYCFDYIFNSGIQKIYYSNEKGKIICIKTKDIDINSLVISKCNKNIINSR